MRDATGSQRPRRLAQHEPTPTPRGDGLACQQRKDAHLALVTPQPYSGTAGSRVLPDGPSAPTTPGGRHRGIHRTERPSHLGRTAAPGRRCARGWRSTAPCRRRRRWAGSGTRSRITTSRGASCRDGPLSHRQRPPDLQTRGPVLCAHGPFGAAHWRRPERPTPLPALVSLRVPARPQRRSRRTCRSIP